MRLKTLKWSLVAVGMTLSVLSVAAVGSSGLLGSPAKRLFAAAAAASVQTEREVDLNPEQQLGMAREFMGKMEKGATTVRTMLEQAQAARDVVKAMCLRDKLMQIDVAKRSARDRVLTLQSAVDAKDKDRSRHEFMIMQVLRDRVEQLVKEANQCIGEELGFIGESQVTAQVSPDIPDNNPDELGSDPEVISETPVYVSPIQ
jgi:hypothetical protein